MICQLRVGDGSLAQAIRQLLVPFADGLLYQPIDGGIHPADEERGHGGYLADIASRAGQVFEAADVGLAHILVGVEGEYEGDVYVDAFSYELPDGDDALGSRRHLHQHIGTVQGSE